MLLPKISTSSISFKCILTYNSLGLTINVLFKSTVQNNTVEYSTCRLVSLWDNIDA